jgi:hypothetical protein
MRHQPYAEVDDALRAWAQRTGFPLQTVYRDDEVRTFSIAHPRRTFQLWIEPPSDDDFVVVQASDNAGRKALTERLDVPISDLPAALDRMLAWIQNAA